MINNNILLITDDSEISDLILSKLILLRNSDRIDVCDFKTYKKNLENTFYPVVILHERETEELTIKAINNIKTLAPATEILLLLKEENKELILSAYDSGIFDYFFTSSEDYEMLIKTVNCFKMQIKKEKENLNNQFLTQLGAINSTTNLYEYKYLKDIFINLSDNLQIKNGVFAALSIDEKIKTRVSTNRLAKVIKNALRDNDIGAIARGGKFYLILSNTTTTNAKIFIEKIQNSMGDDYPIRAGFARIGVNSFETLEQIAGDGMICATQNELLSVNLEEGIHPKEPWLDENWEPLAKKPFKLFNTAFKNKLENVIIPIFYRYQKELEAKFTEATVSHYANNIECVFSLKDKNNHSELIIRYDGYAKFNISISHSGLESAENTNLIIPLNKLTNKQLTTLLNQLKDEYKS